MGSEPGRGWLEPHSPYIVVRGTNSDYDGVWYDRRDLSAIVRPPTEPGISLNPTGRFERREDGMVAEVYEP